LQHFLCYATITSSQSITQESSMNIIRAFTAEDLGKTMPAIA
jgi:hypothetical protein